MSLVTGRKRFDSIRELQLALVIPLSDECSHLATRIQVEILQRYGHNPGLDSFPHITLKMGFAANDIEPFAEYLDRLASEVAPFAISIKNFDCFDEGILFLNVESNPALENLRQRILRDMSGLYGIHAESVEGPDFRFHVTLAHGLSQREFEDLRRTYATGEIKFQFTANKIDLFYHTGNHWVTYKRARMVGKKPILTPQPNPPMPPPLSDIPRDSGNLLYRRQFILSPDPRHMIAGGKRVLVGGLYHVSTHKDLELTHVESGGRSLTLLGFALDPERAEANNTDILQDILKHVDRCDDVFNHIDKLGGRWVIIAHDGSETILLHDATGQRQVCYTREPVSGIMACASESGILAEKLGLSMDAEAVDFVRSRKVDDYEIYWMPGDTTLFSEIAALLPNHYLTLSNGGCRRFRLALPTESIPEPQAISTCLHLLRRQLEAARRRYALSVPMTAGWDSRLMLALTKENSDDLHAFTLAYPHLPAESRDVAVPGRLLARLGIPHHVIPYPRTVDREFQEIFWRNNVSATSAYCRDVQALHAVYPSDRLCVTGDAAEIVKCHYPRNPANTGSLSAEELADFSRLGRHPFVIKAFTRWLDDASEQPVELLDLFCWEQMAGRWQAKVRSEYDMVQESFAPLNNRSLLVLILSMDREWRRGPEFKLFTVLIDTLWHDVLSEPINPPEHVSLKRKAVNLMKKTGGLQLIPESTRYRIKKILQRNPH